jgi:hypothetical protein
MTHVTSFKTSMEDQSRSAASLAMSERFNPR